MLDSVNFSRSKTIDNIYLALESSDDSFAQEVSPVLKQLLALLEGGITRSELRIVLRLLGQCSISIPSDLLNEVMKEIKNLLKSCSAANLGNETVKLVAKAGMEEFLKKPSDNNNLFPDSITSINNVSQIPANIMAKNNFEGSSQETISEIAMIDEDFDDLELKQKKKLLNNKKIEEKKKKNKIDLNPINPLLIHAGVFDNKQKIEASTKDSLSDISSKSLSRVSKKDDINLIDKRNEEDIDREAFESKELEMKILEGVLEGITIKMMDKL